MKPQPISDIPSFQKLLNDVKAVRTLRLVMPLLRPVMRRMGIKTDQIDAALAEAEKLESAIIEMTTFPDRFNDLLGPRGWIIYELMNMDVARAALEKAEDGDLDAAEALLVDYFSPVTVELWLKTLRGIQAFQPRMELAEKALRDYREGRYYASVLVVLSLLDGLVNELHRPRQGFFAENANLEAWDSIAAHSKGLNALAAILRKGRHKTTTEQITIPYRHGIMHGMDLGYDNKIVAAKLWAALFAVRDWALKAEKGLLTAQPQPPKTSWREIMRTHREHQEFIKDHKEHFALWKPRLLQVGSDLPVAGQPDQFAEETPERKLAEYLAYWEQKNYGFMAKCVSVLNGDLDKELPPRLREAYANKRLIRFEFISIIDSAPAITEIDTFIEFEENGQSAERKARFRLVYQDNDGSPLVRGQRGGEWRLMNT